jgi:hypothetical protein
MSDTPVKPLPPRCRGRHYAIVQAVLAQIPWGTSAEFKGSLPTVEEIEAELTRKR